MLESQIVQLDSMDEHKFLGRRVIYTSKEDIDENTIPDIVNGAMQRHLANRIEIEYLFRYFRGDQPILSREKPIRPDVNNRVVINNAWSTTRNSVGYFLGEPIQYTAKQDEQKDDIGKLNSFMDSENKACEDMSLGNDASICGTSHRLVATDDEGEEDEAPFEIPTLNPLNTFVIYSTKVGNKPVLGVTYNDELNNDGSVIGNTFTIYDNTYQYIYSVKGSGLTQIKPSDLKSKKPHLLGDVPIVEYPNNEWRMGDFEMVLTIFNAINTLHSDRVNSVEQTVNSILVFIGCHLKTAEENKAANAGNVSDFDLLKANGAIELPNADGGKADVKYVFSQVDQNEAETLAQTLIDYVYAITGIPDRKTNSNGGSSDTGDAVYLRDGYQALEIVARTKERAFRKSERTMLRMVCRILDKFDNIKIRPMDIDIKFIRNRTNNLVNKSQALANFHSAEILSPEDEITLIGVTDDPKGMAARGETYWKEKAKSQVGDKPTEQTIASQEGSDAGNELSADRKVS